MTKQRKTEPKVDEPLAGYDAAPPPAAKTGERPEIRFATAKDVEALNKQLMEAHHETLRKLAK